ncbi:MAG: hypothetical protein ACPGN3_15935 [Opitutales bacterium]
MKLLITISCAAFVVAAAAYQPQPPKTEVLKEDAIIDVPLNEAISTLLVFPGPIQHLSGSGLVSDGEGQVQYGVGVSENTLTAQPLISRFNVLMYVMVSGRVYAFQLRPSSEPASVIRFQEDDVVGLHVGSTLELPEVQEMTRLPSEARIKELVRLAKEETALKPQLPELYRNSESRQLSSKVHTSPYEYSLEKVTQFRDEDTLIFMGTVRYIIGPDTKRQQSDVNLRLIVNDTAVYKFSPIEIYRDEKDRKKPLRFVGVLVGNGEGGPGHIALSNDFGLSVSVEESLLRSLPTPLEAEDAVFGRDPKRANMNHHPAHMWRARND